MRGQRRVRGVVLLCDCTREYVADLYKVLSGHTTSCGCRSHASDVNALPAPAVGTVFGEGTVIGVQRIVFASTSQRGAELRCSCGKLYSVSLSSLYKGNTRSCGHLARSRGDVELDSVFGNGTVVGVRGGKRGEGTERVALRCVCGTVYETTRNTLLTGKRTGCSVRCTKVTTHGLSAHPLYGAWSSMVSRCHNDKDTSYDRYGARGISVYAPWHDAPTEFLAWADVHLGPKPSPQHSLDRIDNDGNYEPGNLRWATKREQYLNRRPSKGSLAAQRIAELETEVALLRAKLAQYEVATSG